MAGNNYLSHPVYTILTYDCDIHFIPAPWIAQAFIYQQ